MKSKELRIGNWVKCIDGNIIQIDKDYMIYILTNTFDVEPIPLTEEILLNCGFETTSWDSHSTFRNMFCSEGTMVISLEHKYIEVGDLTLDIEVKYLHQLQNLYFSLTGKELEIKF